MPTTPLATAESTEELGGHARWYAERDTNGSTLLQPAEAPFAPGGANGTRRAARITGRLASHAEAVATLVLQLDASAAAVLASPAVGFGFSLQRGVASSTHFRVVATCVDGDAFGLRLVANEGWAEYVVPFTALKPKPGNRSTSLDPTKVRRIEWQVLDTGESYDLAVDEVVAVSCKPDVRPPSCLAI